MSNFYRQCYNQFNFVQPISPLTYNSNPVAATKQISTSNEQNSREEKQEDLRGKGNKQVSAQAHRLVATWKGNIQVIESHK